MELNNKVMFEELMKEIHSMHSEMWEGFMAHDDAFTAHDAEFAPHGSAM
jgi:hypothetical protein